MHAIGTQDRTYCTRIIIDIPQKKQGVAATLAYPYVGPTYVNVVVAKILHRYYFTINITVKEKWGNSLKGRRCTDEQNERGIIKKKDKIVSSEFIRSRHVKS